MKNILMFILLSVLVFPASASTIGSWTQTDISGYNLPEIISWSNNKTNNNAANLTVNISENVRFSSAADQTINTWNWYRDNTAQGNNYNNFSTSWNDAGTKTVKVNATNSNGTSLTITWNVTVVSISGLSAPIITSWSNSKTNNNNLSMTIYESESIRFNITANQTVTSWLWTLNGNSLNNPFDNLTRTFNNEGSYRIGASGSNVNGSTQIIIWNIIVSEKDGKKRKNATIISWYPQVVDYIEVNSTLNEMIDYSITTFEEMTTYNWSVDGKPVIGYDDGSTYSYTHTWNNSSVGAHTVRFKGNNSDTKVEFRWYVNVYREGTYSGENFFDIIDEALSNHVTDLKIKMFKYKVTKGKGNSEYAAEKVNQLQNEIAKRQIIREALRKEFKAGNITIEEYVAAMKQVELDSKYKSKLAKGYANIAKDHEDDESEKEFKKISEIEKREDQKEKEEKREEKSVEKEKNEEGNNKGKNNKNEHEKKGKGKD